MFATRFQSHLAFLKNDLYKNRNSHIIYKKKIIFVQMWYRDALCTLRKVKIVCGRTLSAEAFPPFVYCIAPFFSVPHSFQPQ